MENLLDLIPLSIKKKKLVLIATGLSLVVFLVLLAVKNYRHALLMAGVITLLYVIVYMLNNLISKGGVKGAPAIVLIPLRLLFLLGLILFSLSFAAVLIWVPVLYIPDSNPPFDLRLLYFIIPGLPLAFFPIYTIEYVFSHIKLFLFDKKRYILVLRSFTYDDSDSDILSYLSTLSIPVMKIGDPKTPLPKGEQMSLYLPTNEGWKKHLNYYIEKAKYVFAILGATDGLFWELFYHLDQKDKFIYCIPNYQTLVSFLGKTHESWMDDTPLMFCLNWFADSKFNDSFSFCIIGNKMIYGHNSHVIDYIVRGMSSPFLMSISIPIKKYSVPQNANSRIDKSFNKRLTVLNTTSRVVSSSVKTTTGVFSHGLLAGSGVFTMLFGVFMTIGVIGGADVGDAPRWQYILVFPILTVAGFLLLKANLKWFKERFKKEN